MFNPFRVLSQRHYPKSLAELVCRGALEKCVGKNVNVQPKALAICQTYCSIFSNISVSKE